MSQNTKAGMIGDVRLGGVFLLGVPQIFERRVLESQGDVKFFLLYIFARSRRATRSPCLIASGCILFCNSHCFMRGLLLCSIGPVANNSLVPLSEVNSMFGRSRSSLSM